MHDHQAPETSEKSIADRRQFLAAAGRFAQSTSIGGGGGDDDDSLALLPLPLLAALGAPGAPVAAVPLLAAAPEAAPAPLFAAAAPMAAPPVQTRVAPASKATPKAFAGTPIQRAGERG